MAANDVADLLLKIDATTEGLRRELKKAEDAVGKASKDIDNKVKSIDQRFEKLGAGVKRVAAVMAGALAGIGLAKGFQTIIKNTMEQERVTAQLEATLRSTGRYTPELSKNLQAYAAQLQTLTTYGDEAIIGSQSLLLTFTRIGGEAFPRAQKAILDVATAMGTDLKSATLQIGKALNDPILGLTALQRTGIQFSETQKQMIKDMVAVGDVAGAQAVILSELETQFGGSAEAARDTLGGALQSLKNSFGDLLEGDVSGQGINGTVKSINDLNDILNDPAVKQGFRDLTELALSFAGALAQLVPTIKFVADEIKAFFAGPQIGDIVRINEQLEELQQRRVQAAGWGNQAYLAQLDAEIAHLEQSKRLSENLIQIRLKGQRQGEETLAVTVEALGATEDSADATRDLALAQETLKRAADPALDKALRDAQQYQREVQGILDALYPQQAAVRELTREYHLLRAAVRDGMAPPGALNDWVDANVKIADTTRESAIEVENLGDKADPLAESWQAALERIDNAFVDLWKSAFDGFKDFADALKNAFFQLLGELAHRATTQKILISLGMTTGSGAAMASGGGGGTGGLGNLMSLKGLAGLLDSTPLAGLGMALQDFSAKSGIGGLFDIGTNMTNLSAMDLGLSALAGYAGNFLGGKIGQSLFGKEAESAWGATLGGIGGTLIGGPIGALLGSTIGGFIDVLAGGDGKTRSAVGVQTNAGWMGADRDLSAVQIEAESGLLLTSYAKRVGEEAAQTAAQLTQMFAATDAALTSLFTSLGVTVDLAGQTLDGINSEFGEDDPRSAGFFGATGFNGELSADQLAGAADAFVLAWADRVNELAGTAIDLAPLQAIQREGELLADVLLRANAQFAPVNAALEALGLAAYQLSVQGMASADALVQMLGGLENFTAATSQYYQLFYSEEERLAQATEQLQGVFAGLNMAMPETNAQFRAIVEGLDLTTETGQATFATLMRIAPAFNQVTSAAEAAAIAAQELAAAQAEQARQAQEAALAARNNTLADIAGTILGNYQDREKNLASLEQQLGSIDDQIMSVQEQIADASSPVVDTIRNITASVDTLAFSSSQLRSIADNLLGTAASLRLGNLSPLTHLDRLEEAQRQYEEANRAAQNGDASGLASAAQAYLQQAAAYYASSPAYVQIFDGVVGNLEAMGVQMDAQADAAERQERAQAAMQSSLSAIQAASSNTSRLTELYGELDKLMQEKQLVEQQIANLTATTSQDILSSQLDRLISITDGIDSMAALLGNLPASIADGLAQVIGMAIAEYRDLTPTEAFFDAVPAFAGGGNYGGGLALVGEQGPELINFRTPGFVHNATDTRDMLSGDSGEVVGELKALRQEVAQLRKTVAEGSKAQVGAAKETTRATEDVGRKLKTPTSVLS